MNRGQQWIRVWGAGRVGQGAAAESWFGRWRIWVGQGTAAYSCREESGGGFVSRVTAESGREDGGRVGEEAVEMGRRIIQIRQGVTVESRKEAGGNEVGQGRWWWWFWVAAA